MIETNTPLDSFMKWLESFNNLSFGSTLFAGEAPSSDNDNLDITWVVMGGGNNQLKFITGEAYQIFNFSVYHRSLSFKKAQKFAYDLVEMVTCDGCFTLEGYNIIELSASSMPVDNDRDSEGRKVVLVQITAVLESKC